MKHLIENLTRRPVTLMGNSGKYYHLPPRYKFELAALEVTGNAFAQKLALRNVLAIHELSMEKAQKASSKETQKATVATDKPAHKAEPAARAKRPQ